METTIACCVVTGVSSVLWAEAAEASREMDSRDATAFFTWVPQFRDEDIIAGTNRLPNRKLGMIFGL
jgi:hypothetical protein